MDVDRLDMSPGTVPIPCGQEKERKGAKGKEISKVGCKRVDQ